MQNLPPETLGEIFYHCLPSDALNHLQPDVTTGPMLLCQVCSYWRAVALTTPVLWESLHHVVRVSSAVVPSTLLLGCGIDKRDVMFLKWWKNNLGEVAPKLRLGIRWIGSDFEKNTILDNFFLSFVSSARHLDLDRSFASVAKEYFRGQISNSTSSIVTLLVRRANSDFKPVVKNLSKEILHCLALSPFSAAPGLRQLFLDSVILTEPDFPCVRWSNLTHAILVNVLISNQAWPKLIRQCVDLEFAVFHIGGYDEPGDIHEPPITSLPKLRQLVVKWNPLDFREPLFIFKNLTFPSLTALRLESFLSVGALHEILDSTPSLKELDLSYCIPKDPDVYSKAGWFPGPELSLIVDPLSFRVPHLRRLVLQVNFTWNSEYRDLDYLIDVIMRSPWLGLTRKGSLVKEVALTADYSGSREFLVKGLKKPLLRDGVRITALEHSPWWMDGDLAGQYVMDPFEYSRFCNDRDL